MKKESTTLWGILILAVGVIFLGNSFSWWNIDIFFDGWWTLFIIIPSIYGLIKKEWTSSIFGLIIGILLLLASQDIITWKVVWQSFFPIILILIGLSLIFKPKMKYPKVNHEGLQEYVGIFSTNETKITEEFKGARAVSIFGEVNLDLRKATIKEDIVIDCVSVFGGIDIKLPRNVRVKANGVPIFGGVENKCDEEDGPTIIINYVCVFAGIDVK